MDTPFLGMIQYWGCNFSPKGYMYCNGQVLNITSNTALFSLLGTTYGGNGQTTFGLPNLQGRSIIGSASQQNGIVAGVENVSMTPSNLPAHTHTGGAPQIGVNTANGSSPTPQGMYPASSGRTANLYSATNGGVNLGAPTVSVAAAGSSTPIPVRNPYLGLGCTISTVGLYPSRN